jgi:hypothetical protein
MSFCNISILKTTNERERLEKVQIAALLQKQEQKQSLPMGRAQRSRRREHGGNQKRRIAASRTQKDGLQIQIQSVQEESLRSRGIPKGAVSLEERMQKLPQTVRVAGTQHQHRTGSQGTHRLDLDD